MKRCICCEALHMFREAVKHPNIETLTAARRANLAFRNESLPEDSEAIARCPIHGSIEALGEFWRQYDRLADEVNAAARPIIMRRMFAKPPAPAPPGGAE